MTEFAVADPRDDGAGGLREAIAAPARVPDPDVHVDACPADTVGCDDRLRGVIRPQSALTRQDVDLQDGRDVRMVGEAISTMLVDADGIGGIPSAEFRRTPRRAASAS